MLCQQFWARERCLQLLLDALSRDDTTDVLLQQCNGFLFVRLRPEVLKG